MRAIRKTLALFLALVMGALPIAGAFAEPFSPVWAEMTEGYRLRREPIRAALSIQCGSIRSVSGSLLQRINGWLEGSSVLLESRIRDENVTEEHVKADFDGAAVLDCWVRSEPGQTLTVFDGERGYLTDPGKSAYETAAGVRGIWLPREDAFGILFGQILPYAYEMLELNGAAVTAQEERIRLSPAGQSLYQTRYEMEEEVINGLWPGLLSLFENGLKNLLSLPGETCAEWTGLLSRTVFSGKVSVLRLFDSRGLDMGIRVTGRCMPGDGSTRKVNATVAYGEDTGLYVELKLPNSKGSYSDQWTLKIAFDPAAHSVKAEGSGTRKDALGTLKVKLDGAFADQVGETEHLSGSVTLSGEVYGTDRSWSMQTEMDLKYGYGEGTVFFSSEGEDEEKTTLTAYLQLGMGEMDAMPECTSLEDLRSVPDARIQRALEQEEEGFLSVLLDRLSGLEYAEWAGLLHAFRNDSWMEGWAVETNGISEYTVDGTDTEWSVN